MTFLADANVLVAITVVEHVHHDLVLEWFEESEPDLATCPITQGALLRFLLREGTPAHAAVSVVRDLAAQPWHSFWSDDISYDSVPLGGVVGHRQVTDAYLVALSRQNGGKLVTLDRGLAALHGDVTHLLSA